MMYTITYVIYMSFFYANKQKIMPAKVLFKPKSSQIWLKFKDLSRTNLDPTHRVIVTLCKSFNVQDGKLGFSSFFLFI